MLRSRLSQCVTVQFTCPVIRTWCWLVLGRFLALWLSGPGWDSVGKNQVESVRCQHHLHLGFQPALLPVLKVPIFSQRNFCPEWNEITYVTTGCILSLRLNLCHCKDQHQYLKKAQFPGWATVTDYPSPTPCSTAVSVQVTQIMNLMWLMVKVLELPGRKLSMQKLGESAKYKVQVKILTIFQQIMIANES